LQQTTHRSQERSPCAALEAALHRMPERRSDDRDHPRHTADALAMPDDPDSTPESAGRRQ
jgi:hypothetical protein